MNYLHEVEQRVTGLERRVAALEAADQSPGAADGMSLEWQLLNNVGEDESVSFEKSHRGVFITRRHGKSEIHAVVLSEEAGLSKFDLIGQKLWDMAQELRGVPDEPNEPTPSPLAPSVEVDGSTRPPESSAGAEGMAAGAGRYNDLLSLANRVLEVFGESKDPQEMAMAAHARAVLEVIPGVPAEAGDRDRLGRLNLEKWHRASQDGKTSDECWSLAAEAVARAVANRPVESGEAGELAIFKAEFQVHRKKINQLSRLLHEAVWIIAEGRPASKELTDYCTQHCLPPAPPATPPTTPKEEGPWINVYRLPSGGFCIGEEFPTKAGAESHTGHGCLGQVPVSRWHGAWPIEEEAQPKEAAPA